MLKMHMSSSRLAKGPLKGFLPVEETRTFLGQKPVSSHKEQLSFLKVYSISNEVLTSLFVGKNCKAEFEKFRKWKLYGRSPFFQPSFSVGIKQIGYNQFLKKN